MKEKIPNLLLAGLLTTTACSSGEHESKSASTTKMEVDEESEKILDNVERLNASGLRQIREGFREEGKIKVFKGVCIAWESYGGVTVTINPGYYEHNSETLAHSFFVFTGAIEGNDRSSVVLMNGPYEHHEFDESGEPISGGSLMQIPRFLVANELKEPQVVTADLALGNDGSRTIVDIDSGEPVIFTKTFPDAPIDDIWELCVDQMGFTKDALEVKISSLPEGPGSGEHNIS